MTALQAGAPRMGSQNTPAMLELFATLGSFVYGLALEMTGSPSLAAAVTEDVFLLVWADPAQLGDPSRPIRDRLGRLAHRRAVQLVRQDRAAGGAGPPGGQVTGRMDMLSTGERAALQLTYFGGHTLTQAATMLGHPVAGLVGELRSALDKLTMLRRHRRAGQQSGPATTV